MIAHRFAFGDVFLFSVASVFLSDEISCKLMLYYRYLHERLKQVQEEVTLLKSNIQKYKVRLRDPVHFGFQVH